MACATVRLCSDISQRRTGSSASSRSPSTSSRSDSYSSPSRPCWTNSASPLAALALLADHLGDDATALARSEGFMRHVVAYLDNAWCLTSADIDEALAEMG